MEEDLKESRKFCAKIVQKGVEISYHKHSSEQKKAMNVAAKAAEVQSRVGNKVARAANIEVFQDLIMQDLCARICDPGLRIKVTWRHHQKQTDCTLNPKSDMPAYNRLWTGTLLNSRGMSRNPTPSSPSLPES